MRILFIHQNFPGQFKLLAAYLAQQPGFEVAGLGDAANLDQRGGGIRFSGLGLQGPATE
jgi:hypothetical protein